MKRKAKTKDWYKGPKTKKHIAELRYKLALTRGFLMQLQFAIEGLPSFVSLSTESGEVDLNPKFIENLLKETADP